MTALNIVPECYVDTKLIEILVGFNKCNHQHGCGDVSRELLTKLKNNVSLGVIDQDLNKGFKAKYLKEFYIIKEESNLILQKHPGNTHYLILICPEIEEWLLNVANSVKIDPESYGLPKDLKGFKKESKSQNIDKNIGFYRFIKELIKSNAKDIITLKKWIEYFYYRKFDLLENLNLGD